MLRKGDPVEFPLYPELCLLKGRFLGQCWGNPAKAWVCVYPYARAGSGRLRLLPAKFVVESDRPTPLLPLWASEWKADGT